MLITQFHNRVLEKADQTTMVCFFIYRVKSLDCIPIGVYNIGVSNRSF